MDDDDSDDAPDDYFWENLLDYIEQGKVVPIIGPDLVTVLQPATQPGGEVPLYRHLAGQLAKMLRIRIDHLGADFTLNEVVCCFLEQKGPKKKDVFPGINRLLKAESFPPSQCLMDLAGISRLNLFVSTTFDGQLASAINARRFGGNAKTQVISYSQDLDTQGARSPGRKTNPHDLPCEKKDLERPVVYHLLGTASVLPDYVVCDEDLLEFLLGMQTKPDQAPLLFDELKHNHLLILGCSFSDWLSRFFIRLAKGEQLSGERDHNEILVDAQSAQDKNLSMFFNRFSSSTKIIRDTPAVFVAELARRWHERHPEQALLPAAEPAAELPSAEAGEMEAGAVFLSYASDDVEAVERMKTALEAAGVDVWFDRKRLTMGDDWDRKIRRNIESCGLCVPVVSSATDARAEGYFRREWAWAVNRAEGIADEVPFLLPVTIDDTRAYTAKVPERFRAKQWAELPGGQVTAEFAEKLKQWQRDFRKRQRPG
jgi:hypothetical protein